MTASTPANTTEALRPIAPTERVALLDVLRGLALYGVLLANTVPWYSGHAFLPEPDAAARIAEAKSADGIALLLIAIFVDSKSMSLLSFLFGLGFAMQLVRAEEQGRDVLPVYLRRLGAMAAIGVCHVVFLWWGDILVSYALTGLALLLFWRCKDRTLFVWAVVLIFVPQLVAKSPLVEPYLDRVLPGPGDRAAWRAHILAAFRGDDHGLLMRVQAREAFYHLCGSAAAYIPWTIGRFLLGYIVGRRRWLHDAPSHLPMFRKLLAWGGGLALVGAGFTIARRVVLLRGVNLSAWGKFALIVPREIGILAMVATYVSAVVLLMQRPAWRRQLMILAPVGRMPLTNYLFQSLICTFLFYGWGLGLIGHVGPALCIPLTLAIFAAQTVASHLWLRRFRFGPMEWVWRTLTYGRRPAMRRAEPGRVEN